jgi:hypothetical protein
MSASADARRWVAFHGKGAARLMLTIQAEIDDIEGAVSAGQYEVAAFQARAAVVGCLSVRSLAVAGEIDSPPDQLSFSPFAGLSEAEVGRGLSLAAAGLEIEDGLGANAWLTRLRTYAAATEALLGFDEPLPVLRSPEGLYPALRLARQWLGLVEELGLPPLLPAQWTQAGLPAVGRRLG